LETHLQYKARIQGLMTGKDPVTVQRATPATLAALVSGVPAEKLYQRPSPDKWSVTATSACVTDAKARFTELLMMISRRYGYRSTHSHKLCDEVPP
jgi:hypothetical protein